MSVRLINALERVKHLPEITLGNILTHIEGEALLIVSLVAILPFLQPIPIPGLSSVLGLVVFLQGLGLAISSKPILTERLKKIHITHDKFEKIYTAARKFSRLTAKLSVWKHSIVNTRVSHFLCGISIIFSALFLSLPLPIPFSNLIPALSIFLICIGLLEDDILIILSGLLVSAGGFWMAVASFYLVQSWISNFLG